MYQKRFDKKSCNCETAYLKLFHKFYLIHFHFVKESRIEQSKLREKLFPEYKVWRNFEGSILILTINNKLLNAIVECTTVPVSIAL